jgi:hypothetical protein
MTLRALIIGIMVWIPSTFFASASWSQSQPNRVKPAKCGYSYDYSYPYGIYSHSHRGTDYYETYTNRPKA